jgi:phosphohistidine phosphatase SixA
MSSRFTVVSIVVASLLIVLSLTSLGVPADARLKTPASTSAATLETGMLEGKALVEALQQGGYIIFFRHASTDMSVTDTDRQNLENCATQRNLNDKGRTESRIIGQAFRALKIPIGEVLVSAYCRTRDTAELAFGRYKISPDLLSPFSGNDEELVTALRRLFATLPSQNTNTVLVSHMLNLFNATSVSIAEGEAAIYRPDGKGGFQLVARVLPQEWANLVGLLPTAAATGIATASHPLSTASP